MRRVAALLMAVAALAGVAVAYAESTATGLPKGNAVFGGGHYLVFGTENRDFSLTATKGVTGSKADGTLLFGYDSNGSNVVQITCMNVSGATAVVGGIVRSSSSFTVGEFVWLQVVDSGLPGGGPAPDTVSAVFTSGQTGRQPCPAFDNSTSMYPLTGGDVLVNAAT